MPFNSAHTGAEIDAAVQMMGQIQEARDSTKDDLVEVRDLAAQVDANAAQVGSQTASVTAKSEQVAVNTLAVEQAREQVSADSAVAEAAKGSAAASAEFAEASRVSANASQQAASQSQIAAGISEQVTAEHAETVGVLAQQVADNTSVASTSAEAAASSAQLAVEVVDGFGNRFFATYALMVAVTPKHDGTMAWVQNDPTKALNGFYRWFAAVQAWVKPSPQMALDTDIDMLRLLISRKNRPRGKISGDAPLIFGAGEAQVLFGVHQKVPRGPSESQGTVPMLGKTPLVPMLSLLRPRSRNYDSDVVLVSGNSVMLESRGSVTPEAPVITYDAKLIDEQGQKPAPKRYAAISAGQVWSYGPDGAKQVTQDGEWFAAQCVDFDVIRALKLTSGGLVPYTITQDGRIFRDGKVLIHKLSTGQSLALGSRGIFPDPNGDYVINGIRGNLFSPLAPPGYADKLWTLSGGPRPAAWEGTSAFEPVREYVAGVTAETPATSYMLAMRKWHERMTSVAPQMLYSVSALGGTPYAGVKKGTKTYTDAMSQITTAKAIASTMGLDYVVPSISIVHGESQRDTTQAEYVAMLGEWISDYRADIVAITAQAVPPVAFISQMLTGETGTIPAIPLAQLQAHNENPYVVMVGPKYAYPYFDTYHMQGPGYMKMGELEARAERLTQISGKWQPLKVISAAVSGATITLRLNNLPNGNAGTSGPIGNLAIDTTIVTDPGNYGFQLSAGTIATVAIGGDGVSIVITATAAIAAGTVLTYALQPTLGSPQTGNGRRGCIRDNDHRDFSRYDMKPLYNWLCAFSTALEI